MGIFGISAEEKSMRIEAAFGTLRSFLPPSSPEITDISLFKPEQKLPTVLEVTVNPNQQMGVRSKVQNAYQWFLQKVFGREHPKSVEPKVDVEIKASVLEEKHSLPRNGYQERLTVSSGVIARGEIAAGTSSIVRGGLDVKGVNTPHLSALGMTTAFNFAQGVASIPLVKAAYDEAVEMHDKEGIKLAEAEGVLRVGQVVGGAGFIGIRSVDIFERGFKILKSCGGCTKILNWIGMGGFEVLYIGLVGLASLSFSEHGNFLDRLEKAKNDPQERGGLMKDLLTDDGVDLTRGISKKELHAHLGIGARALLSEINPELASNLSNEELGSALFEKKNLDVFKAILSEMGISSKKITVEELSKDVEMIAAIWKRERDAKYERFFGSSGMEALQNARETRLYERIYASSQPDLKNFDLLLDELKKGSQEKRYIMVAYLVSGLVGAFSGIVSLLNVPGAIAKAASILFLVSYVLMFYGDVTTALKAFSSEGPVGKYDTHYVALHLMLGVVSVGIAIGLNVLSGGIPFVVIAIIGGTWILNDLITLSLLKEKQRRYVESHPSVLIFMEKLKESNAKKDDIKEMFHKLPRLYRDQLLRGIVEGLDDKSIQMESFLEDSSPWSIETRGKVLYEKGQYKELIKVAIEKTNKKLLEGDHFIKGDEIKAHPCKDLFYKTFYHEWIKFKQEAILEKGLEKGISYELLESFLHKMEPGYTEGEIQEPSAIEWIPAIA